MALLFPGSINTSGNLQIPGVNTGVTIPSAPSAPSAPIGVKAATPTANVTPAPATLTPAQTAQTDLSGKYANVGGTIYNTQSGQKFSNPADFFKDSGQTSFNNLKFSTSYTPTGKETIYGAAPTLPQLATQNTANNPAPVSQPAPTPTPTPAPTPSPTTTNPTPATNTGNSYYTPPNQGTTGVSQGGLIGNLNTNAINNPLYTAALQKVNDLSQQQTALQTDAAKQQSFIQGSPFGLSEQLGQQGILQQLLASKQAALAPQYNAAVAELQGANTAQSNTTSGLSAATNANAPITGVQPGTQNISPSQPVSGLNTGQGGTATTSGAANISQLVGAGNGSNGHPQGEYFNTQTGQGFSTPQQLSDFVNSQVPGANTTPASVFTYLQQQQSNPQGSQGGSALNPIGQVDTIAQQVINHQLSPSQAASMGGSVANWSTLLNQAMTKANGGQPIDTSALQAQFDANQSVQGDQAKLKASFQSAQQQGQNLTKQFSDLISTYGLNPQDLNVANGALQAIAANTSDWRYQALSNYANDIANTYASILGAGGTTTDMVRNIASQFINQTASGMSIKNSLDALDQQASAKIAGVQTPSTTGNSSNSSASTGGGLQYQSGQTAAGGGLVYQNGKWVVSK